MGAVYFYHLTSASLEQTLPMLLEKSRAAGWKVEVRGRDDDGAMNRLDAALWNGSPEGFLPHGVAGGPHDADQPILLTSGQTATNGANCVMSVHGTDLTPEDVQGSERCCILFDGYDDEAVAHARTQWKALTGAGCAAQYWAQDDGRWIKKAEA